MNESTAYCLTLNLNLAWSLSSLLLCSRGEGASDGSPPNATSNRASRTRSYRYVSLGHLGANVGVTVG